MNSMGKPKLVPVKQTIELEKGNNMSEEEKEVEENYGLREEPSKEDQSTVQT